jgi:DNA repair protein RAD50
MPPHT